MERLTKIEVQWIVGELENLAATYRNAAKQSAEVESFERSLCNLKAEQYDALAKKLSASVQNGNKRIAIDY